MFKSNRSPSTPALRLPPFRSNKMRPSFRAEREISLQRSSSMIRRPFLLLVLLFVALAPFNTSAQVQTGTPPFGSFSGGPDVVNLANLNDHWTIPVLHKPGRGTNFTYDLGYDSSVWVPVTSGSTKIWQPVNSTWGWQGL